MSKTYEGKYDPKIPDYAYRLCLLGLSDEEMALTFAITLQTWYNWQEAHFELRDAISRGRVDASADVAKRSLDRALGYEYEEEVAHVVDGTVIVTKLKKHMPPHPTMAIFWLKNKTRRLQNPWKDVTATEVSGKDGGPIQIQEFPRLDLSELNDEELKLAASIGLKFREKKEKEK